MLNLLSTDILAKIFQYLLDDASSYRNGLHDSFWKLSRHFQIKCPSWLKLDNCTISLDWLDTLINELNNLQYLTLDGIYFFETSESKIRINDLSLVKQRPPLKVLKFIGDGIARLTDAHFKYFLKKCPAVELDMTGTKITHEDKVINYCYEDKNDVLIYVDPSPHILSFTFIFFYLKEHKEVIRRFVADDTGMTFRELLIIMEDKELRHLHVSLAYSANYEGPKDVIQENWLREEELKRISLWIWDAIYHPETNPIGFWWWHVCR